MHQICATAFVGCQALDLQEQFPPIQPKQHQPIAQQNRGAAKKWFQPCAGEVKEIPTQVDVEGAIQKPFHEVRDTVCSDRVHPNDKRERPF